MSFQIQFKKIFFFLSSFFFFFFFYLRSRIRLLPNYRGTGGISIQRNSRTASSGGKTRGTWVWQTTPPIPPAPSSCPQTSFGAYSRFCFSLTRRVIQQIKNTGEKILQIVARQTYGKNDFNCGLCSEK